LADNDNKSNSNQSPGGGNRPPSMGRGWLIWIAVAIAIVLAWPYVESNHNHGSQQLTYTAFKHQVAQGHVKSITIKGQKVNGQLNKSSQGKSGKGKSSKGESGKFTTVLPPINDPNLMGMLEKHNVTIKAETTGTPIWLRLLVGVAPWILLIALIWWGSKKLRERMQGGGGMFSVGKSKAKRIEPHTSNMHMSDVAGCENAKIDVVEIIDFLSDPARFHRLGANMPKGVLLMGPPGTGKTILAKAVAGEAGVPFFSISGSEFVEMFVGVGASRVRDMFKQAKEAAPAIIFIDEIDSVGRSRGSGMGGGHDEREQTLNQILSEMDGFTARETVVVMAATNRPQILDAALLRPGRFDRKISFELPGRQPRFEILKVHTRQVPCADDVDLKAVAAQTVGFSGADLANLINEAAMLTARDRKERVDKASFDIAYNRIVLGAPREDIMSEDEKRVIAFHESGHTLMARLLKNADPVDKVTIIPRGQALGATQQTPEHERYNLNESYLKDRIRVMLGGRGAEKLIFGEVSTGAAQDLKQATQMAHRMVSEWGMSEAFGASAFSDDDSGSPMGQQRSFSEYTARLIDEETRKFINSAERSVDELLTSYREKLEILAHTLLEHETVQGNELDSLLGLAKSA
jgi:cell division protease FtsH